MRSSRSGARGARVIAPFAAASLRRSVCSPRRWHSTLCGPRWQHGCARRPSIEALLQGWSHTGGSYCAAGVTGLSTDPRRARADLRLLASSRVTGTWTVRDAGRRRAANRGCFERTYDRLYGRTHPSTGCSRERRVRVASPAPDLRLAGHWRRRTPIAQAKVAYFSRVGRLRRHARVRPLRPAPATELTGPAIGRTESTVILRRASACVDLDST